MHPKGRLPGTRVARAGGRAGRAAATAVLSASLVAAAACGGSASTHSTATTAAPSPLVQAAAAMASLQTYRFSGEVVTGPQQIKLAGEFTAPDRVHETLTVAGVGDVELVLAAGQTYQRVSSGGWAGVTSGSEHTGSDPRQAFLALGQASVGPVNGNTYTFELRGPAAAGLIGGSSDVSGSAVVDAGRVTDLSYRSAGSPATSVHLVYTDIDTTPAVTIPSVPAAAAPATPAPATPAAPGAP